MPHGILYTYHRHLTHLVSEMRRRFNPLSTRRPNVRKMNAKELREENERLNRVNTIFLTALNFLGRCAKSDGEETFRYCGNIHTLTLYGATRADGGTLVYTITHEGELPFTTAYSFEEYFRAIKDLPFTEHTTKLKGTLERLMARRNEILFPPKKA